jgi:hypothetical protein
MAAAVDMSSEEPSRGFAPVFYPGTPQLSAATSVKIGAGEERQNLDVRLQFVRLARVSGLLVAAGPVPPGAQVTLVDVAQQVAGAGQRSTRIGADGRFTFVGVPPGQYSVFARATFRAGPPQEAPLPPPGSKEAAIAAALNAAPTDMLWAASEIAVNGEPVSDVALQLQPGMSVSGTVVFDGAAPGSIDLSRLRVSVVPAGAPIAGGFSSTRDAPVDAGGRFTIQGVAPGRYRLLPGRGVPSGYALESAIFAGKDVLDFPLEVAPGQDASGGVVTFSTRATEIAGSVRGPSGSPATDLSIIVFPVDSRFWTPQSRRIQAARPTTEGRFTFRMLPPGDYRLVAIEDPEPGQWFDPDFLRQIGAGSIAVSLAPGEKKRQDVTSASGGDPSTASPARTPSPRDTASLRRRGGR